MISCPRCHHQNNENVRACELCNAPLREDEISSKADGDDILPLSSKKETPEKALSIPEPSKGVPFDSGGSGLAKLLGEALNSAKDGPELSQPISPLEDNAFFAEPDVASISDQELSEFLLDALSDSEPPPSVETAPPKPQASIGLFDVPTRAATSIRTTMEIPGVSFQIGGSEAEAEATEHSSDQNSPGHCSNCGGSNPSGMFYCVYCGFSLSKSQETTVIEAAEPSAPLAPCNSCGAMNPAGNRFCGSCGHSFTPPRKDDVRMTSKVIGALDLARKAPDIDVALISINEDGSDGLEIPLDYAKSIVGRTGDTRFPTDSFLSPKHACVTVEEGQVFIEDLYSLNGTFVKLKEEVTLSPGDVFLMGRQVLRFEKFEQNITPKARSSDGTRYMGSPPPGGAFKLLQVGIGGVIQNVYCIPETGAVLGREKGDIIFPRDKFMSGRHAQIYPREDNAYCLVDLNSSNGTWIKIWEKTPVKSGHFVFMGQQLFRIDINGTDGSAGKKKQ